MNGNAGERWVAAMQRGDFDTAWAISDAVLASRDRTGRDDPRLPYHLRWVWDGTPPDGRDVLVRCYHGLGDTLQFCRFLPALGERAASLTVEAQPELLPVLRALPGVDRWIGFDQARPAPTPDGGVDLEIMELSHALRLLPDGMPYFPAPDGSAARSRLEGPLGPGMLVGAAWQVGGWMPSRSLPLRALCPVLDAPGLRPVLLQRGPAAEEALGPDAPRFANPHDRSLDILDTAALLAACDRVVTVDTMVAHLAGALGRPGLVLLPAAPDWRWPAKSSQSPWYSTLRIARQATEGDWAAPLAEAAEWLKRPLPPLPGQGSKA